MNTAVKFFIEQQKLSLLLMSLSLLWFTTFYRGILAASDVWWTSEIFHHCFFVLPISAWLIYLKRNELIAVRKSVNYLAIPLLMFLLFIQAFGVAGDIKLLQYVATFAVIPCLFLFFMGFRACLVILFPLFFLVFAIPVGDELIPALQIITADLSVYFLNLTGISIFRDGLFIEISNGKFFVAEACSGISFLIVSIVFGSLYAYLYLQSIGRKLLFVFLAFAVPIIANALRVMGIVIIGDVWGMEYAGGTDHLIYGSVFYCFVLFVLITIGEKMKDKGIKNTPNLSQTLCLSRIKPLHLGLVFLLMLCGFVWQLSIQAANLNKSFAVPASIVQRINVQALLTNPTLMGQSRMIQGKDRLSDGVEIMMAWFDDSTAGDPFSAKQKLFDRSRWQVKASRPLNLQIGEISGRYKQQILIDMLGQPYQFISLYRINDRLFANKRQANLYYAWLKLTRQNSSVNLVTLLSKATSDGIASGDSKVTDEVDEQMLSSLFVMLD